jgi:predicted ester cyclase
MGLSPTGKSMTVTGLSMNRIVNGKIAEAWTEFDLLGMLQQLGVVLAQG